MHRLTGYNGSLMYIITNGYFQITVKDSDIPKSDFVRKFRHLEMLWMPFGLNDSASTSQHTITQ